MEIEKLKNIPIVDVIGKYITLKKVGTDYKACCPFHDEKTPSFVVKQNATENFYKCFGCGAGGDAITFVQKYKNLNFVDACKVVAEIGNITIENNYRREEKPVNTKYIQTYQKPKINAHSPKESVIAYFSKRAISEKTLLMAGITESTKFFAQIGKEGVSINFNYYRNNELINVKHRHIESKSFGLEKDCELIFWNLDNVTTKRDNHEDMIIITEGEIDALSLMEAYGTVSNIVSVPNGASSGKNQNLSYLDCPKTQKLFTNRKLCLAFDNDNPGRNLKDAFVKRFGEQNCYIVQYHDDCKDLNDVLVKHGKDDVKEVINCRRYNVNGVTDIADFENTVDNYYENGFPNCDRIGISSLDELIGFRGGELTMVTGTPGSGKSVFLDFLMVQLSQKHDWKWGVCSMETPQGIHTTRLISKWCDKPFRNMVSQYGELIEGITKYEYEEVKQYMFHYFKFITHKVETDEKGEKHRGLMSLDYILTQAKTLKSLYGIKGLVIDPWNTIEHQMQNNENETNYVSRVLSKIIAFAEDFDVHVFLVAHPTKGVTNAQGIDRVATMNDISGSGNFFAKTHNGISVFRDKQDTNSPVQIHVQKIKFEFVGQNGVAYLDYNRFTGNYTEAKEQIQSNF